MGSNPTLSASGIDDRQLDLLPVVGVASRRWLVVAERRWGDSLPVFGAR